MPFVVPIAAGVSAGAAAYSAYKNGKLMGKDKSLDAIPSDIRGLRREWAGAASGATSGQGPFGQAFTPLPDSYNTADNSFFMKNLLNPYREMFAANRELALAGAKESAGNLTGSGYNNLFGSALAQSLAQENSGLADVMSQLRTQEINRGLTLRGQDLGRQRDLLGFLQGFGSVGVGVPTTGYQPGLLDSVAPILGTYLAQRQTRTTPSK